MKAGSLTLAKRMCSWICAAISTRGSHIVYFAKKEASMSSFPVDVTKNVRLILNGRES